MECNTKCESMVREGLMILRIGEYEISVPYKSCYPEEFKSVRKLYICEFCLEFENSESNLQRHEEKCVWHCPPGIQIYSKNDISIFEVDGPKSGVYCENLCLLSKLFVKEKIQYQEVENFLFYVLTIDDNKGCHIMGYFSKSKDPFSVYNLSSMLTLSPYRRQGFGRMLVDFSYLLSKMEGKCGTPEGPLSVLGMISYSSYWKNVVGEYLDAHKQCVINIKEMSQDTAISIYDIIKTLKDLNLSQHQKGGYIDTKQMFAVEEGLFEVRKQRPEVTIDPSCLQWTPPDYILDFEANC